MNAAALGLIALLCGCGPADRAPVPVAEIHRTPAPPSVWAMDSITLYLPAEVFEERIPVAALVPYISKLQAEALSAFATQPEQKGVSGSIVVMVKPGGRSRVWIVTGEPMNPAVREALERHLKTTPPPEVKDGPVVFGLLFSAWGGGAAPGNLPNPVPDSWERLSADGPVAMNDEYFNRAWELE